MIKVEAIQNNIKKIKMIFYSRKCFCLDFDKLKITLSKILQNKTFKQIKNNNDKKICKLVKPLNKINKFYKLTDDIKNILSEHVIYKISIDSCQRVIGYFTTKQNTDYFYIFLYDPFHQYNFIESNKGLETKTLIHLYDFLKISSLNYKTIKQNIKLHNHLLKHKKILKKE